MPEEIKDRKREHEILYNKDIVKRGDGNCVKRWKSDWSLYLWTVVLTIFQIKIAFPLKQVLPNHSFKTHTYDTCYRLRGTCTQRQRSACHFQTNLYIETDKSLFLIWVDVTIQYASIYQTFHSSELLRSHQHFRQNLFKRSNTSMPLRNMQDT